MTGTARQVLWSTVRALGLSLLTILAATLTLPAASAATGDVQVAIEGTPVPVKPGQHVLFTVTFANGTAASVSNWNVSATVPQFTRVESNEDSGALCNGSTLGCGPGGMLAWTVPSLAAGESRSVTFVARVNASSPVPPDGTVLQSTATATSSAGTDSSMAEVVVTAAPTMTLGLVEDPDPVVAGGVLNYALVLGNLGATQSPAGVLKMPVPPGTTFVSATGGGSLVGGDVLWNVAAMPAGTNQRYQLVVQVGATAASGDLIESEAEFSAASTNLARAQRVTAVVASPPAAAVALAASPDPVKPGERVWFTLTYANRTDAVVANWKVTATVPEYATVESNQDSGALCNGSTLGCGPGGTLSWTASSLAAGESRSVTYVARVASGASAPPEGMLLRSNATVTSAVPGEASASAQVVVDPTPTMALSLVEDSDPVAAGGLLTYTLVLGNLGGVQSPAGALSLAVPAGTTFVSATGGGTLVGNAVQWNVAPIAPGASNRYQAVVETGGTLPAGDLLRSAADFSAGVTTLARADVVSTVANAAAGAGPFASVALAATPDPVKPGERVWFTLTFANRTGAPIGDWKIAATVPDHTTVESNQDSGALCNGSTLGCGPGGTLTWTVPSLAAGESRSVTYVARVASGSSAPADGTLLRSTATVTSALPGEVSASADIVVDATPTMTLGMVENRDPVPTGGAVVYTLVLGNPTGVPGPAGVLRMSIPPGTTVVSATGGGSLSGNEVQWNVAAVAAGTAQRQQVVLLASPSVAAGDLLEVGAAFAVGITTIARASVTTLVAATEPNASIEMTASPDPAKPGERVLFAVTFANRTGFAVNDWTVTATVPDYTTVESNEDSGALCNGSTLGCGPGGTLSWTVPSLAAGESRTVAFWALVGGGASAPPDATLLRSTATVTSALTGEASTSAMVVVDATPLLALAAIEDQDPVPAGGVLTYALSLGNRGTVPSPAGVLTMAVPAGTAFESATGGGTLVGNLVQWNAGPIAAGTSNRYELRVRVDAGAPAGSVIEGVADVVAGTTRLVRADVATTVVTGPAPAAISVSATPNPVKPGERVQFTVTFANRTGFDVNNWKVTATVPEHATVESNEDSGALCNGSTLGCGSGGTLGWSVPSLAAGESRTLSFWALVRTGAVAPPDGVLLRSVATVTSAIPGEASASASIVVDNTPQIELAVVETEDPVLAGSTLGYTLLLSNRAAVPSPAGVLSMRVPAGATFVAATGGGNLAGDVVQWNVGAMAAGATLRYDMTVQVGAGVTNGAVVEGVANFDAGVSNLARASAATTVTVDPPDVDVALSVAPNPVKPGERATFTLTFGNRSAGQVNGWNVSATVPEHTTVDSSEDSGALCDGSSLGCTPGGTLAWTVPSLDAGESRTLTFAALVSSGSGAPPDGTLLRSVARVASALPGEVTASMDVAVDSSPQMSLGIVESEDPVLVGSQLTYSLVVSNRGTATSPSAVLSVRLPGGATFVSASGSGSHAGGIVQWNVPSIPAGTSLRYQLVVQVGAATVGGTLLEAAADLSAGTTNLARASVATGVAGVPPAADITIAATPDPVKPGERVTFTLTFSNLAGVPVDNWTVRASVPDYTSVAANEDSGALCNGSTLGCVAGGTLSWTVPTLAAGESRAVTYAALAGTGSNAPPDGTLLVSTARVSSALPGEVSATTAVVASVVPALPPPGDVTLLSAASRKTHGAAGTFDLPLNLTATSPTTEPRSGGAGGNHTIVFVFDSPVVSGTAAVTAGPGTAGTPTFSGNEMTCSLAGVANQQYVTVAVSGVWRHNVGRRFRSHRLPAGGREPEPGGDGLRSRAGERADRAGRDGVELLEGRERERHADGRGQGHREHADHEGVADAVATNRERRPANATEWRR